MNKFTLKGMLVSRDIAFHQRHPYLTKEDCLTQIQTGDEIRCALILMDTLKDIETDDGTSLFRLLCSLNGTCEAREEVFAMGIYIERLYKKLASVYGDNVTEIMLDIWGCYDLEWVPEMAVVLIEDPRVDLFMHCASKIDAYLEKNQQQSA